VPPARTEPRTERTERRPDVPTEPDEELLVLVIRAAKALVDRIRAERPDHDSDMTVVHGLAARYLLDRDDVTAAELARYLGITKQSTSEVVTQLEKAGFMRRAPHPNDGRARVLLLTDEGKVRLLSGIRRWHDIEDEWAGLVGRDRLDVVRDALRAYLVADAGNPRVSGCAD
jgi:DNA-binding MarR family transcriptional regulator